MPDTQRAETSRTEHPNTTAAALRRRTVLAGLGAAAVGGTGVAGATDARGGPRSTRNERSGRASGGEAPAIIAHRGFAGCYPENTVGAVAAAAKGGRSATAPSRGADAIEIDVVPTADEDVVVFHDSGLSERDGGERGLTDVDGLVWETDTATVTNAEVLESGETVPTLRETLDAIPTGVAVNVELKNPGSSDLRFAANLDGDELATQKDVWRPFVERVLSTVDDYDHRFLFSSFYEAALATTREASDYAVAPLLWDSIEDGLDIARTYDAEALHPPYNMVRETPFFADPYYTEGSNWADTDLVATAHDEGRDVNVYTLATWYQAEQLAAAGVDGLIADYPDLLRFGSSA